MRATTLFAALGYAMYITYSFVHNPGFCLVDGIQRALGDNDAVIVAELDAALVCVFRQHLVVGRRRRCQGIGSLAHLLLWKIKHRVVRWPQSVIGVVGVVLLEQCRQV